MCKECSHVGTDLCDVLVVWIKAPRKFTCVFVCVQGTSAHRVQPHQPAGVEPEPEEGPCVHFVLRAGVAVEALRIPPCLKGWSLCLLQKRAADSWAGGGGGLSDTAVLLKYREPDGGEPRLCQEGAFLLRTCMMSFSSREPQHGAEPRSEAAASSRCVGILSALMHGYSSLLLVCQSPTLILLPSCAQTGVRSDHQHHSWGERGSNSSFPPREELLLNILAVLV